MPDFSRFFENATDLPTDGAQGEGLNPTALLEQTGFDTDAIAGLIAADTGNAAGNAVAEANSRRVD